jgi:branched-chain amino acid transport system substrate-binding protein
VLRPFTGKYASVGAAAREGASAAAQEINDAGGVMGRKLVLDSADTLGDPADAVPALNKLVSLDHVVGIVGPGGAEIGAVQPILDRDHIPFMFGGGSTQFDSNTDPYFFRVTPSDSQLGVAMAVYAYQKGYRKAVMMFSTIEAAQTLKDPVSSTFQRLGGTIAADVNVSPGQLSYRSEVLKVTNAQPDVIFTQMDPPTAAPVFSNFKEVNGLAVPFVGTDITAGSDFITAITPAVANKSVVSLVGSSAPGAGQSSFKQYYSKLYSHDPLGNAVYSYDALIVLALATEKAGSTDPDKIKAAIKEVSNSPGQTVTNYADGLAALKAGKKINYEGASGPMDFNSHNNVFGPFDVVQAGTDGNLKTVTTISATDLARAAG